MSSIVGPGNGIALSGDMAHNPVDKTLPGGFQFFVMFFLHKLLHCVLNILC